MNKFYYYLKTTIRGANNSGMATEISEPTQPTHKDIIPEAADMKLRMQACMVLSGVGDAVGYNDGKWEFCPSGERIQAELQSLGGIRRLKPTKRHMIVSDDTVMHIATAEAILCENRSPEDEYCALARKYKQCMNDMRGRAPGLTCMSSVRMLHPDSGKYAIPFNPRGGGCGAAMRAVPIGLLYWRPEERDTLVRVAIEAGRMTHNHPTGFLGCVAVALFVSYALQGREAGGWGAELLRTLPAAKRYCQEQRRDWGLIRDSWTYFEEQWSKYVRAMQSVDRDMSATEYDGFVRSVSYMGTGGASGHDAPMIAYEAIRRCCEVVDPSSRWEQLCRYGMFHGGDSDSTGIIAGACYGAMYGLEGVPTNNYAHLEYRERLEKLGAKLFDKSNSIAVDRSEQATVSSNTREIGTDITADPQNDISEQPSGTGDEGRNFPATKDDIIATKDDVIAVESDPISTEGELISADIKLLPTDSSHKESLLTAGSNAMESEGTLSDSVPIPEPIPESSESTGIQAEQPQVILCQPTASGNGDVSLSEENRNICPDPNNTQGDIAENPVVPSPSDREHQRNVDPEHMDTD